MVLASNTFSIAGSDSTVCSMSQLAIGRLQVRFRDPEPFTSQLPVKGLALHEYWLTA